MAEENENKLFRKSALNSISSVDELDIVLKVTNPSAWIGVGAILALIIGLFIWAVVAEVPITTTTKVLVRDDGKIVCWVDSVLARKLMASDAHVIINGKEASIASVGQRPMSSGEIKESLGDGYIANGLDLAEWNYQVDLEFSENLYDSDAQGSYLAPAEVVTAVEHPIALIFGG